MMGAADPTQPAAGVQPGGPAQAPARRQWQVDTAAGLNPRSATFFKDDSQQREAFIAAGQQREQGSSGRSTSSTTASAATGEYVGHSSTVVAKVTPASLASSGQTSPGQGQARSTRDAPGSSAASSGTSSAPGQKAGARLGQQLPAFPARRTWGDPGPGGWVWLCFAAVPRVNSRRACTETMQAVKSTGPASSPQKMRTCCSRTLCRCRPQGPATAAAVAAPCFTCLPLLLQLTWQREQRVRCRG